MPAAPIAALRHRNFRIFLAGQVVSLCGTWMQAVAQGWLILQLTDSPFAVGVVTALGGLPVLLFTLYGGVVADRVDKRKWIALLQGVMLLEALALGVLTQAGRVTPALVGALAVVAGLAAAFEIPARQAFVVDMVGREDLMNAIALNSSVFNVTRVVGPSLAGLLITGFGTAACFYANAVSFLAAILGFLVMRFPSSPPHAAHAEGDRSLAGAVRYLREKPRPRTLILLTAALSVFGFSFVSLLPVYARDVLGRGAAGYGGLVSATGIGASVAAIALAVRGARVGRRRDRTVAVAAAAFGACLVAAGAVRSYWAAAAVLALGGGAMIVNNVLTNTLLQTEVPNQLRGRLMGFYSLIVVGLAPLGAFQAGWVAEHLGARVALFIGGGCCALAAGAVAVRAAPAPSPAGGG